MKALGSVGRYSNIVGTTICSQYGDIGRADKGRVNTSATRHAYRRDVWYSIRDLVRQLP